MSENCPNQSQTPGPSPGNDPTRDCPRISGDLIEHDFAVYKPSGDLRRAYLQDAVEARDMILAWEKADG